LKIRIARWRPHHGQSQVSLRSIAFSLDNEAISCDLGNIRIGTYALGKFAGLFCWSDATILLSRLRQFHPALSSRETALMPRTRRSGAGRFRSERRKIRTSGVLDALIEYAEGRRDMSSSQVSAALGLLKKAVPDLATETLAEEIDREAEAAQPPENDSIEFRIVDPDR
jgi:hypothetical protein